MSSYGSQPTPRWPASGPASPSGQPSLPGGNGDQQDEPGPQPDWQTRPQPDWQTRPQPDWQTGPQPEWQTAEGAPWPDWPGAGADPGAAGRGQAAGPEPSEQPDPGGPGQPGRDWQSGQHWPLQPLSAEPASGQWSAQLRRQAPAVSGALTAHPTGSDELWAMISYLGIPFLAFLPPLFVYLVKFRSSSFARQHATQALNLSVTVILYNVCAVIVGGLLALDSVAAALAVMIPVLAVLWLVTLAYLVLAGTAAGRGGEYRIPGWLCATLVR